MDNNEKVKYEVISEYPNTGFPIGLILTQELPHYFTYTRDNRKYTTRVRNISRYPHIFKPLNQETTISNIKEHFSFFIENQSGLDPHTVSIINQNFWELF
jgi:hypothetical protein